MEAELCEWQTRHVDTWDAAAHIWIGACHRAGTCESHKLVTSFVDHKTANCGDTGRGAKKTVFKINQDYKEYYQEGRNAEEIKGKFIFTLTLESLFADAPEWKKRADGFKHKRNRSGFTFR